MKRSQGFTVIEVIVVAVFLGLATVLLLMQRSDAKNGYYPSKIDENTLVAMDPDLFTDPKGATINKAEAEYHYDASNCQDNKCKSYKLTAEMEKEATYVKKSRNN